MGASPKFLDATVNWKHEKLFESYLITNYKV